MRYVSTRGGVEPATFRAAVLSGLCDDGGLYVPTSVPRVSKEDIARWGELPFAGLAFEIMRLFVPRDELPDADLRALVDKTYGAETRFRDPEIVHTRVGAAGGVPDGIAVLELFHGPTFAFKDVALQFLGNLFEYFMATGDEAGGKRVTVVGATSGDTGSAALHGLRGKAGVEAFILFPDGRVSEIQQRQMTSILDDNVHCIAVDGNFDDCQDAVKAMFRDLEFKRKHNLAAVNSINWARILAQIVYYFRAYYDAGADKPVSFAVPTGNFGNILAGWYAREMGLPVERLVLATNENDILHRFFTEGVYEKRGVRPTVSPSMDIQVASNFERFVFHLVGCDGPRVRAIMDGFAETSRFTLTDQELAEARAHMVTRSVDEAGTMDTVARLHREHRYLACPHTAIGIRAAEWYRDCGEGRPDAPGPVIALATAHPGKFGAAVERAIGGGFALPPELAVLLTLETRVTRLPSDPKAIAAVVSSVVHRDEGHEGFLGNRTFTVRVPGSSANLGPGYDALGLAVSIHLEVRVTRRAADPESGVVMTMEGEGAGPGGGVPLGAENLILKAARRTAEIAGRAADDIKGCNIDVRNAIPLGRGLGSSSAAIVAGVMIADRLLSLSLSRDAIFRAATEIEGHPDNVCAAVYGGLRSSISSMPGGAGPIAIAVGIDPALRAVVAVPDYQVATADARAALPSEYSAEAAVFNVQHVAALVAALPTLSSDPTHRAAARGLLRDRLHQSQRAHLLPGFAEATAAAENVAGCVAACLSGAGPTIVALSDGSFDDIGAAMVAAFRSKDIDAQGHILDIDTDGAVFC